MSVPNNLDNNLTTLTENIQKLQSNVNTYTSSVGDISALQIKIFDYAKNSNKFQDTLIRVNNTILERLAELDYRKQNYSNQHEECSRQLIIRGNQIKSLEDQIDKLNSDKSNLMQRRQECMNNAEKLQKTLDSVYTETSKLGTLNSGLLSANEKLVRLQNDLQKNEQLLRSSQDDLNIKSQVFNRIANDGNELENVIKEINNKQHELGKGAVAVQNVAKENNVPLIPNQVPDMSHEEENERFENPPEKELSVQERKDIQKKRVDLVIKQQNIQNELDHTTDLVDKKKLQDELEKVDYEINEIPFEIVGGKKRRSTRKRKSKCNKNKRSTRKRRKSRR
jgi:uncharacterized protein YoxC